MEAMAANSKGGQSSTFCSSPPHQTLPACNGDSGDLTLVADGDVIEESIHSLHSFTIDEESGVSAATEGRPTPPLNLANQSQDDSFVHIVPSLETTNVLYGNGECLYNRTPDYPASANQTESLHNGMDFLHDIFTATEHIGVRNNSKGLTVTQNGDTTTFPMPHSHTTVASTQRPVLPVDDMESYFSRNVQCLPLEDLEDNTRHQVAPSFEAPTNQHHPYPNGSSNGSCRTFSGPSVRPNYLTQNGVACVQRVMRRKSSSSSSLEEVPDSDDAHPVNLPLRPLPHGFRDDDFPSPDDQGDFIEADIRPNGSHLGFRDSKESSLEDLTSPVGQNQDGGYFEGPQDASNIDEGVELNTNMEPNSLDAYRFYSHSNQLNGRTLLNWQADKIKPPLPKQSYNSDKSGGRPTNRVGPLNCEGSSNSRSSSSDSSSYKTASHSSDLIVIPSDNNTSVTTTETSQTTNTSRVTPDSSSYLSPDMDFLDFDLDPTVAPPSEQIEFVHTLGGVEGADLLRIHSELNIANPETNNLNECNIDSASELDEELYNVSIQTSTSNFDNDENSFQENDEIDDGCYCKPSKDDESDNEEREVNNEDNVSVSDLGLESANQMYDADGEEESSPENETANVQELLTPDAAPSYSRELAQNSPRVEHNGGPLRRGDSHGSFLDDLEAIRQVAYTCAMLSGRGPQGLENCVEYNDDPQIQITDIWLINLLRERQKRTQPVPPLPESPVERVMIWGEYEAYIMQVKQIGTSACGPTAVINVLKAFNIYPEQEAVTSVIQARLRCEASRVPQYLLSRSQAGTTAADLIEGISQITDGAIYGRFFHFFPERQVNLAKWLAEWLKKGAVPLATLNLQLAVPAGWMIPDAWHHQMIYGVSKLGIHLTNPLEVVPPDIVYSQLFSDSVLLVRRNDIINRWDADTDITVLMSQPDPRWRTMNVLGQVVNVMRESQAHRVAGYRPTVTSHIKIPAAYKGGISLFVRKDSDVYKELIEAPELPLKEPEGACARQR